MADKDNKTVGNTFDVSTSFATDGKSLRQALHESSVSAKDYYGTESISVGSEADKAKADKAKADKAKADKAKADKAKADKAKADKAKADKAKADKAKADKAKADKASKEESWTYILIFDNEEDYSSFLSAEVKAKTKMKGQFRERWNKKNVLLVGVEMFKKNMDNYLSGSFKESIEPIEKTEEEEKIAPIPFTLNFDDEEQYLDFLETELIAKTKLEGKWNKKNILLSGLKLFVNHLENIKTSDK